MSEMTPTIQMFKSQLPYWRPRRPARDWGVSLVFGGRWIFADFQVDPNPPGVGVLSAPPPWDVNGRELPGETETHLLHMKFAFCTPSPGGLITGRWPGT